MCQLCPTTPDYYFDKFMVNSINTRVKNYTRYFSNFPCHFYLLYLLLSSCNGNDKILRSHYARETVQLIHQGHRIVSRSVAAKQSGPKPGWLPNLGTYAETCVQDTRPWHQWLEAVPHWHIGVTISQSIIDEAVGQWRKWLRASVEAKGHRVISVKLKPALFRATDSLLRKTLYFASVLL